MKILTLSNTSSLNTTSQVQSWIFTFIFFIHYTQYFIDIWLLCLCSGLDEEGLYRVAGVSSKFNNLIKVAIGTLIMIMIDYDYDYD